MRYQGHGEILRHNAPSPQRARSWPSPTVRSGEGLVEIEVNDVEPHHTRIGPPKDGVHVGTIVVEEGGMSVDELRDF